MCVPRASEKSCYNSQSEISTEAYCSLDKHSDPELYFQLKRSIIKRNKQQELQISRKISRWLLLSFVLHTYTSVCGCYCDFKVFHHYVWPLLHHFAKLGVSLLQQQHFSFFGSHPKGISPNLPWLWFGFYPYTTFHSPAYQPWWVDLNSLSSESQALSASSQHHTGCADPTMEGPRASRWVGDVSRDRDPTPSLGISSSACHSQQKVISDVEVKLLVF